MIGRRSGRYRQQRIPAGARAGKPVRKYHKGGNLPFFRRLPFVRGKGFTPFNRVEYNEVNLDQLVTSSEEAPLTRKRTMGANNTSMIRSFTETCTRVYAGSPLVR